MKQPSLSPLELRDRVARAGHEAGDPGTLPDAPRIKPPVDAYITVGANLDPTLKAAFRDCYFCCLLISPEEPVAAIRDDPEFSMPRPFREVELDQPSLGAFADGPFRWLLRRLLRFESVLLWPAAEPGSDASTGFVRSHLLDELPRLKSRLPVETEALADIGAVVLDLTSVEDCRLLWEAAISVSTSSDDWYVSDADCREVYLMHHHDKVVVSIPDESRRNELLLELDRFSDVIENYSNYESDEDELREKD